MLYFWGFIWDRVRTWIQPIEETGLVIKVRGHNLICSCSSHFPPNTHWMLPVGMWNESDGPALYFFSFFLIHHVCLTDQSQMLSDFLPFSLPRPCIIALILICCHPPSPLLRFVQSLSPIRAPSYNLPVTPSSYLPSPTTSFHYSLSSHLLSTASRLSPTRFKK